MKEKKGKKRGREGEKRGKKKKVKEGKFYQG